MRGRRIARGVAAAVLALGMAMGCAAGGNGPRAADDDLPEFSAARLGESVSLADDALSPAEREAARESWATAPPERSPLDDPAEDDPFAENAPPKMDDPPRGPVGRALDATGRFFVSFASVAVSLGMAVAPMFAMMGI